MLKTLGVIAIGASFGAILRWFLGLQLNQWFPNIPLGTLIANLFGGYIVGLAIAYFAQTSSLSPEWRLLIITGFCGGLTTFSTFSVEVFILMQQARWSVALLMVLFHVLGTLVATFLGVTTMVTLQWFQR